MQSWFRSAIARRFVSLGGLLGVLVGCSSPGDDVTLHGDVRLTLLHTADWHSRLFPYYQEVNQTDQNLGLDPSRAPFGGAARMNYLIQRERRHADRVLHLDSGDCFQGAPIFNFFNGEAEVRALDHTGVDAVVIGNHEFDRGGLNFARQYSRWATFQTLAANYQFDDPTSPGSTELGRLAKPYALFNLRGLKVGVIGLGNLSSITSIFDQPNRLGITALNTQETTQFYVDELRGLGVDVVVLVSHIGLEDDINTLALSTGVDVVLGGHLHIVLNPTQDVSDCRPFDQRGQHFIPVVADSHVAPASPSACGADECCHPSGVCAPAGTRTWWQLARGYRARACTPRRVALQHSGAFMKYLGRLDLVLSNDPARIYPGHERDYNPADRWEVVSHRFSLFPVDNTVPEEPTMKQLLEPYARALDTVANLDTLIGYAPTVITRTATNGGDSALGNLVGTSMWLRLGIQTDFSLTNTLGIRDNIPAGPVSIDQVYNVFPFDNSITTMNLSGREVRDLFDFVARRSAGRGCNSQAQIAGARVVMVCGSCPPREGQGTDPLTACAETINIGFRESTANQRCNNDDDCNGGNTAAVAPGQRSLCEPTAHRCMAPLVLDASYAAAVNNYIAGGGSGFFVLQRNTTQVDTLVQQRDAVIDFVRQAPPCGYSVDVTVERNRRRGVTDAVELRLPKQPDDGLRDCRADADCDTSTQVCAWEDRVTYDAMMRACTPAASPPVGVTGRCVLRACRDDLAAQVLRSCPTQPSTEARARCQCTAENRAAMSCRILSCLDESTGARIDGRQLMVSR